VSSVVWRTIIAGRLRALRTPPSAPIVAPRDSSNVRAARFCFTAAPSTSIADRSSPSAAEEEHSATEDERSAAEEKRAALEDERSATEEKRSAAEESHSAAEGKRSPGPVNPPFLARVRSGPRFLRQGESLKKGSTPTAHFERRESAHLAAAVLPGTGRLLRYRLGPDPEAQGYPILLDGRLAGHSQFFHEDLVAAPRDFAFLLDAMGRPRPQARRPDRLGPAGRRDRLTSDPRPPHPAQSWLGGAQCEDHDLEAIAHSSVAAPSP